MVGALWRPFAGEDHVERRSQSVVTVRERMQLEDVKRGVTVRESDGLGSSEYGLFGICER
jgi:hypothetical protein